MKTTLKYHHTPFKMVNKRNNNPKQHLTILSAGEEQSNWNSQVWLVGMKTNTVTLEKSLAAYYKVRPTLLDIYSKELTTCVHTKTCT